MYEPNQALSIDSQFSSSVGPFSFLQLSRDVIYWTAVDVTDHVTF